MPASNPLLEKAHAAYTQGCRDHPKSPPSQAEIARQYDIQPSSLCRRVKGRRGPRSQSTAHLRALSDREELALVDYIQRACLVGAPISRREVVAVAETIRSSRPFIEGGIEPDFSLLSANWPLKLEKRHPSLERVWTKDMEASRVIASSKDTLEKWFQQISAKRSAYDYAPGDIYNMDETGFAVGSICGKSKVYAVIDGEHKGALRTAGIRAGDGKSGTQWLTALECISAGGRSIPPLLITKGQKAFDRTKLPIEICQDSFYDTNSVNGWTTYEIGRLWLETVFLPHTQPSDPNRRRMLIVDGHGSHVQARFIGLCIQNNVDLMILPAHLSAITQPLDVGIFGPYKSYLRTELALFHRYNEPRVPLHHFIELLLKARHSALTALNIKAAFRKSGLQPVCPQEVYQVLPPPPSTPPRGRTALARTPLGSLERLNEQLIDQQAENQTPVKSPVKDRLRELAQQLEDATAYAATLEHQLDGYKTHSKAPRAGITTTYLETHEFSDPATYARILERERQTKLKATKRREVDEQKLLEKLQAKRRRVEEAARGVGLPLASILNA